MQMSGDNATIEEYRHVVRQLQLDNVNLRREMRALQQQNGALIANQPKRCNKSSNLPREIEDNSSTIFLKARPDGVSSYNPHRYDTSRSEELGNIAKLYEFLPVEFHHMAHKLPAFGKEFRKKVNAQRSTMINTLRTHAASIFTGTPAEYFGTQYDRAAIPNFQAKLKAPADAKYPLWPPILFPDLKYDMRVVFHNPLLPRIMKVIL
ncbi:hypothetical protein SCP_0705070 [Sparassis crispa]|uniref:Uncharacterized protein n=1 Tax=Sparassis crispa TaxID=139825 RepID=A0A401GT22_9APHY|nr:hypothetical protein SCP_0705070 [Sparassis crispa]GBE85320.1 hypothetical protein SCP_0705070 [Sparassis crispa]